MPEKICLGGSFNPIHHAHLLCARAAAEGVGAGNVVLIPTGQAPHKLQHNDTASGEDRLAMCRLAIEGISGWEIDPRETVHPGPSFTIQTVRQLKEEGWDQVVWLIGADLLGGLPTWHQATAVVQEASLLIMARPGWMFDWDSLPPPFQILRENVVQVPQIDVSATGIRQRVRSGLPIDFLTPPAVCRYILDRKLYR
jgi:nicotinate-nucleotide adenylyltransferase